MTPRRAFLTASFAVVVGLGAPARADDTEDMCIAASLEGQVLERNGRLEKAHARFTDCAIDACAPTGTRERCAGWARAVAPQVPHVTARVKDDRGALLTAAEVLLDGRLVRPGERLAADPGHHTVRASYLGRAASVDVDVAAGEDRVVSVTVDLRRTVWERPVPPWVVAAGLTSVVATGAFALMGNLTLARERSLDACKPFCDPAERTRLTTYAALADVSLGLAAASAVAALIGYLARPTRETVERLAPEGTR